LADLNTITEKFTIEMRAFLDYSSSTLAREKRLIAFIAPIA
jgi:hypothetical protein